MIDELSNDLLISILSYTDLKDTTSFLSATKLLYKKYYDPAFLSILMNQSPLLGVSYFCIPPESTLPFFNKVYKEVYINRNNIPKQTSWIPLDASSTHRNQSIYHVIPHSSGFWSSLPLQDEEQDQYLLFDLGENFYTTVLKQITVIFRFFSYVFQGNQTLGPSTYPSKYIRLELGFHPEKPIFTTTIQVEDVESPTQQVSTIIPIFPKIIFARYVKIRFIGMKSRHVLKDNAFYICVDKVLPEIAYCPQINFGILNEVLYNTYNNQETEDFGQKELVPGLKLMNYIENISLYNQNLVQHLIKNKEEDQKAHFEHVIVTNPQLKKDKYFFEYLMENPMMSDIYFEHLFKKQMHLDFFETILLLELSIDWEKMNPFTNNNFLKNDKYLPMFWLYYFVSEKLQEFILNVFEKGSKIAFELIKEETIEEVDLIEAHESLELKKFLLLGALQKHSTTPASNLSNPRQDVDF